MDRHRVRAALLGLVLLLSAAAVAANVVPAKVPKEEVACVETPGGESACGAVADLAITLDDVDANTRGGVSPGRGERAVPGTHQCVYIEDPSTVICGKLLRDDVLYGNSHPLPPPLPPVTPPPVYPPVPPVTPPPVYTQPLPPVTPSPVYPLLPPVTPPPVYPPVPPPPPPKEQPPHGYKPALPTPYTPPPPPPPPPPPFPPPTVPPRVTYKVPLTPSAKDPPTEPTYNNPHVVPYPPPAPTVKPPFLPLLNYPALGVPNGIHTQNVWYGRQAPQTDQPTENGNYPSARKEETDAIDFSQRAAEQSRGELIQASLPSVNNVLNTVTGALGTGLGSSLPRQTIITCDAATIVRPGISNPVNLIANSLKPLVSQTEYPAPPNPTYRNNGHENSLNLMDKLTNHVSRNRDITIKTNTPEDVELEKLRQEMLKLQNTEKETNEKFRREKEALEKGMNNIRGNSMTQNGAARNAAEVKHP